MQNQKYTSWLQWGPQGELSRLVYWVRTLLMGLIVGIFYYRMPAWDHHIAWVNQSSIQVTLITSMKGFLIAGSAFFFLILCGIWYLHQTVRRLRSCGLARHFLWVVAIPGLNIPFWLMALTLGDRVQEKICLQKAQPQASNSIMDASLRAYHQEVQWIFHQLDRELADPSIAMQVQARTRAMQRIRQLIQKHHLDPNQCRILRHMIQQRQR